MKKIIYTAVASLLFAAGCNVPAVTRVSGTLPDGVEDIFVSIKDSTFSEHVDGEAGYFEFEVPTDLTTIASLSLGEDGDRFWFIADGTPLSADLSDEDAVFVSAKPRRSVQEKLNGFNKWYEEFMNGYMEASRNGKLTPELDEKLTREFVDKLSGTVEDNPDNALGLYALHGLVGQVDDEIISGLLEKLSPVFDADEGLTELKAAIDKRKGTQAGEMYTDFEIEQPDGSIARLSDYVGRGKYILVDFWASWCGPCKREIPNIRDAFEKYAGEKFDVLSVAVWDKPEDTARAAAEHGVVWNQIVDAQRIPTDIYGIEGIPHLILFGPDGTIVKRGEGLRGPGLEETLSQLLL